MHMYYILGYTTKNRFLPEVFKATAWAVDGTAVWCWATSRTGEKGTEHLLIKTPSKIWLPEKKHCGSLFLVLINFFRLGKCHGKDISDIWYKCILQFVYPNIIWAPSSEFVSSSIPSWQILTAHAQPFRGTRDLAFCLKIPLDSLLVWASSGGSGETARMRRLAWTFAARIGDKYQIRLTRSIWYL